MIYSYVQQSSYIENVAKAINMKLKNDIAHRPKIKFMLIFALKANKFSI